MFRDYAPKGVRFYYIYKALAHPGLDGFVPPVTIEERLRHIEEAKKRLGTRIPWLADPMSNELKHTLAADASNAELVVDAEGKIVVWRRWSDPEALREDLARLVGPAPTRTRIEDLDLPPPPPRERPRTGVVPPLELRGTFRPLVVETTPPASSPPYVKLRAEADARLLREGEGELYLGFFLDSIYAVHWNDRVAPLRFEIAAPEGAAVTPASGEGPRVDADADVDPREFLLAVRGARAGTSLAVTAYYFACDDAETFCRPVTQGYRVVLRADRDGGRRRPARDRASPADRAGLVEDWLERDANGDGALDRDEAPPELRRRFDRIDGNDDGALDRDELERAAERLGRLRRGAAAMERLLDRDRNGDGKLDEDEVPPGLARRFERLDRNGDGALDEEELAAALDRMRRDGGAASRRVERLLEEHDRDDDGRLSREEVPPRLRERFDRIDANEDGLLDREEIEAALVRTGPRR